MVPSQLSELYCTLVTINSIFVAVKLKIAGKLRLNRTWLSRAINFTVAKSLVHGPLQIIDPPKPCSPSATVSTENNDL